MVKPFSAKEQDLLLAKPQTRALRCLVRILYHSGLRISDACMLRPQDFDANRIRRVNQKNQETVFIPIPPDLKRELDQIPLNGGYYFLQGQSERHCTQTDAWRTILNDAFKKDVPGFHAHRFRHTAAVNWLASGLTIEEVAALLGNSVKVVEKHYASFCGARQETVERKLQAIWDKPAKLVRVK
jgi:integrase